MRCITRILSAAMVLLMLAGGVQAGQKIKKIVCIGDCITRGVWWSEEVGKGTCWVDKMAGKLKGVEVVNAGRDGLESKHFWYVKDVIKSNPDADVFVLYLGINDLRAAKTVEPKLASLTAGRIEHMINLIRRKAPKAEIVLVSPQRVDSYRLSKKWREEGFGTHTAVMSDLLSGSLEDVAKTQGVRFVNLLDEVKPGELPDGVHPGVAGHERIAAAIADELTHSRVRNSEPIFAKTGKVAPPAAGRPIINDSGADEVAAGIQGDLMAFRGPSPVVKKETAAGASVRMFVTSQDREGFFSDDAYKFAQAAGEGIVGAVDSEMEWQEASGVEAVYDNLVAIEPRDSVEIVFEVPQEPVAEAYITAINVSEGQSFEVLGESVDWSTVEAPKVYNNIKIEAVRKADKQESAAPAAEAEKVVEEFVRIEDFRDSVDLPVAPETEVAQMLFPEGSRVPGVPVIAMLSEDAAVEVEQVAQEEQKLPPLEVPGYQVFVHTFPEK